MSHVTRRDVPTCRLDETLGSVRARLAGTGWNVCGVVNDGGILLGMLRGRCWDEAAGSLVGDIMREGPSTIRPDSELEAVAERMRKRNVSAQFVTSSDGVLIGILRRVDAETRLRELEASD